MNKNISQFIIDGLIAGYKIGELTYTEVSEYSISYYAKGYLTEDDVTYINTQCPNKTVTSEQTESDIGIGGDSND